MFENKPNVADLHSYCLALHTTVHVAPVWTSKELDLSKGMS